MTSWAFYALGTPAPQGSKRHVGRGVMVESSKKVKPWRQAILDAAPAIAQPLDGPLVAKVVLTLSRPSSARKVDTAPFRTPDLSKLLRALEDAITDAGLWADDARVAEYARLAKVWTDHDADALPVPGVIVACSELSAPDAVDELARLFAEAHDQAWRRVRGAA